MTGDVPNGVYECSCGEDGAKYHSFSLKTAVPKNLALVESISKDVFDNGRLLANKSLKMYHVIVQRTLATKGTQELHSNPPFPAWKDGLDDVWN